MLPSNELKVTVCKGLATRRFSRRRKALNETRKVSPIKGSRLRSLSWELGDEDGGHVRCAGREGWKEGEVQGGWQRHFGWQQSPGGEAAAPCPCRGSDSTRKFCSNFFVTAPGRGEQELGTYWRRKYRRGTEAGAGEWAGQEGAQPSTGLGASQGQILQPLVLLAGGCYALRAHTGRVFGEQLKVEMQTEGSEQCCTWKT